MSRCVVSLLGMLCVGAVALPAQQVGQNMQVKVAKVRVHTTASVDAAKVSDLTKGTVVTVVATQDNWVKVKLADQKTMGWIRDDMLEAAPATASADASAASTSNSMPAEAAPPPSPARMAPPPPPPAQREVAPPPPSEASAPMHRSKMASSSSSHGQHGGLALFGGLTSFKQKYSGDGANASSGSASGFGVGLGVVAPMGDHFGIEIDLDYLQTGASSGTGDDKETVHVNNAGGSFLLRPAFGTGSVKFVAMAGGFGRVLVNCSDSPSIDVACKFPVGTNRFNYGAELGVGVMIGRIEVQGRYDIGLANLTKQQTYSTKTDGFLILAGFVL
jgi:hypothetical protein